MSYTCEVRQQPGQSTLSIRTRTSIQELPQAIGKAYGAIAQYLRELGEQPAGPPFVAYYNMNVQDLDVEMGFPVTGRLPGKGDIQPGEIQQGRVATCVHMGPNSELGPAYDALSKWIKDNGYEAADLVYEVYLNDPAETPAQELRTQIVFPLKKG